MRIAFLVNEFPSLSETFILNQVCGLIDLGHSVDIYAMRPGRAALNHPDVQKYRLLERCHYALPKKGRLLRGFHGLGLLLDVIRDNPSLLLRYLGALRQYGAVPLLNLLSVLRGLRGQGHYDIIHGQFGPLGLLGASLRHMLALDAKLVTSFRGYDISMYLRKHGNAVYRSLFDNGDLFLPNCECFKKRLIELGCDEKKILVHSSGIDCNRFRFAMRTLPSDGCIRIVTVGRLTDKKGLEYAMSAVARLAQKHANIRYDIVGDGPLHSHLQRLIEQLQAGGYIRLLGAKNQAEIIEILDGAQLFISTSVTSRQGDEDGPANTLKEAMAMGLPVVSTWHGGIPELVEDGAAGFLVPERDVEAIVEKLGYLVSNPQIWPAFGRAGRERVESQYNIHKLNGELVAVYQQLLRSDKSVPAALHPSQGEHRTAIGT
ncbi:colanic acid biosynthesis glycosyltransferase WcaL [Gloeobacter violaceus]|uniref:Gll2465 protein n=1 Tax=Gloeobacter violaceus (strain ATCC 29082 / PCC 7421) TaxID=251221 RepID=Q7NHS0_GLOVI|nr:colanic acid biosynthesis glycosyltransferase WcaL [Gloeobacter violaceus]BAC90406.1 gll2465 [Gloeobacter violaceus PCC 7421]